MIKGRTSNCIQIVVLSCVQLFAIVTHVFQNGTCAFFQQFLTFIDIV